MFEPIAKGYVIFTNQGISIEPPFFISNSVLLGEHFSWQQNPSDSTLLLEPFLLRYNSVPNTGLRYFIKSHYVWTWV